MSDAATATDGSALELKRLELERYKEELAYKKFKWGSVFAAIVIAAIPPLFQYATAHLEYVKGEAQRLMQAQQFRDQYVRDFLTTALTQDIEQRIRFAKYFASVSSEKEDWHSYLGDLTKLRDEKKDEIDKLERAWQALVAQKDANVLDILEKKRHLDWAYAEVGYAAPNRSAIANPRAADDAHGPGISLTSLPPGKRDIAQLVLDKFAAAGFGQFQQVAALANAIAESGLDPHVREAPPNGGVGLFTLNMNGGLGIGHSAEELMDPNLNIDLIVKEAQKHPEFSAATSLDQAVDVFVRQIERPGNLATEVVRRQQIARQFFRS